ncbi:hypothetical protein GCM10022408_10160 [Hymenobacter fastidiosus]|uniref:Uncharacterized protein n=1 Tax=Hymenobacter fastidiosus TaxID=486264 RepID=A0ABP7RR56_9BACT
MKDSFIPAPEAPHPHLTIEWTAQIWLMTEAMATQTEQPALRNDPLMQPFALHAYYLVIPEKSPKGFSLERATTRHYEKALLDQLVNASMAQVAPLLNWHFQQAASPAGFIEYVRGLIETDLSRLTPFDYLVLETRERNFEATYAWLEIKKDAQTSIEEIKAGADPSKKLRLSHKASMLALSIFGVFDHLKDTDTNKKGAFIAGLIGFNVRKTEDILRSLDRNSEYDIRALLVVQELHRYCENTGVLESPFGKEVAKLWAALQAKESKSE